MRKSTQSAGDEPYFERRTITPEMAAKLLANNTHNRSVNERSVRRLALAIETDEYQFNGQPIQVAKDGTLLDGQHRLLACVKAKKSIDSLIVWNAKFSSQETIDMGKSRSVADILRLRGYKSSRSLAALARRIAIAERFGHKYGIVNSFREVSVGSVVAAAEALVEGSRYLYHAQHVAKLCRFNTGVVSYMMWWLDQIDFEDSIYFWDKLYTGEGLHEGDAIYALRQFALNRDVRNAGTYVHNIETSGLILKAWNKYRCGEPVQRIYFRSGGSRPEEFPQPI